MEQSIKVYQCDEDGYYVGITKAEMSPLEPGVYLQPRGAHLLHPPLIPEGQEARWTAKGWILVPKRPRVYRKKGNRVHYRPDELPQLVDVLCPTT